MTRRRLHSTLFPYTTLFRSDPAIQKMHMHCPWIVTWDDHEVDNNYANDRPEDNQPRDAFLERRANAYQAYYEHMPLRISSDRKSTRLNSSHPSISYAVFCLK